MAWIAGGVAAFIVILGGSLLVFGHKGPLAERLVSEKSPVRQRALLELANLDAAGRAPVMQPLVADLAGPDARKKSCALDALEKLKLPAEDARPALPGLLALMGDPDGAVAMRALTLATRLFPGPADVQAACLGLMKAQGSRLPAAGYLSVLGTIGRTLSPTGQPIPALPAAIGNLVLETPDAGVRTAALGIVFSLSGAGQAEAGALIARGAFSSTAVLQELDDPNPVTRRSFVDSLLKAVPDRRTVEPQLIRLARNPSPALRITAAEVLTGAKVMSTASWNAITGLLKDPVVEVKRATVAAVTPRARSAPKGAVTALIGLLKDKDEGVRADAATALSPLPILRVRKALAAYEKAKVAAAKPAEAATPKPPEGAAADEVLDGYFANASGTTSESSATAAVPAAGAPAAANPAEAVTPQPADGAAETAPSKPAEPRPVTPKAPASPEPAAAPPSKETSAAAPANPDCPMTTDQAVKVAKEHTPRSVREGACGASLDYVAKPSGSSPCTFAVSALCKGEAIATCEVNGKTGEYTWAQ